MNDIREVKTDPDQEVRLASWAKALSHPARIRILSILARRSTCVCGEIVDELPLAQSTVSEHLRVLKAAGLVSGTVSGPRSCYCLDRDQLRRVRAEMEGLFDNLDGATGCGC